MTHRFGFVLATALAAALTGAVTASGAPVPRDSAPSVRIPLPAGPMSILYAESSDVQQLTSPPGGVRPLSGERGLHRQDPGHGGIFDPAGRDGDFRIGKVSASKMENLSAEEIADLIRSESDTPRVPNNTGLVAVDELGNAFNDGRVRTTYKVVTVRGKRIRIASHNRIQVTPNGWRVVRGPAALPTVSPTSLGSRFSTAMGILAGTPHPAGGTYADRVHVYIAPAFASSIAVGRGPHRHLGNDGKPHRATWRGVMPGVARAGGVWLEMYHFDNRSLGTMSAKLWRDIPADFLSYGATYGMPADRLHFLMSGATDIPQGMPRRGDAMAAQWALARSTAAGRTVLRNGVGAYRPGTLTASFLREYNRTLP